MSKSLVTTITIAGSRGPTIYSFRCLCVVFLLHFNFFAGLVFFLLHAYARIQRKKMLKGRFSCRDTIGFIYNAGYIEEGEVDEKGEKCSLCRCLHQWSGLKRLEIVGPRVWW